MQRNKKSKLTQETPSNYIAGFGRGASGFTTGTDIGPPRLPSSPLLHPLQNTKPESLRYKLQKKNSKSYQHENLTFQLGISPELEEERTGQTGLSTGLSTGIIELADDEVGLFSGMDFDEDDEEVDKVYAAIDDRMDSKRKGRREQLLKEKVKKFRAERPKIQLQFADLKTKLSEVTYDQWDSISDPGDISHKHKKQRRNRFEHYTPIPNNTLLEKVQRENQIFNSLDPSQQLYGGFMTPVKSGSIGVDTPVQDITKIGEAKQTIMMTKLIQASDSVTGQTSINPQNYLLSMKGNSATNVGDMKQARILLDSVVLSNPTHSPGWIARTRLEESDGKIVRARKIISKGCQACSKSEDVWIEAARINNPEDAKNILAQAIQHIPNSANIWLAASQLESDITRKKRVLRKALENIPNSVTLWKASIELEKPEDARIILVHALECIPSSVEMWIALAKLETYENAKRATNPTAIQKIIRNAVKSIMAHGILMDREEWIREAHKCEKAGSIIICKAIIIETIGLNIEDEDRKSTWCKDAENSIAEGAILTARFILDHTITVFPEKQSLWLRLYEFEKTYGDAQSIETVLEKSLKFCVNSEILWLMYTKHKWMTNGDLSGARQVLKEAFRSLPDNENIWLAAVKLEKENNEYGLAREILNRARSNLGTERIWLKSAILERELGNHSEEESILNTALEKFPIFQKFYLMLGQLFERVGNFEKAKQIYTKGIKECKNCIPLWINLTRLEEKRVKSFAQVRSLLEKARLKNPQCPELWLESIRLELRANPQEPLIALNMLAKALQDCPQSGILWAEAIEMESKTAKKSRSVEALNRCDQDAHVLLAIAKLFWQNRQIKKARMWFNRAIKIDPDFGDAWAAAYRFEIENGKPENEEDILNRCIEAEPHHGELWISVSKDIDNFRLKTQQILKLVAKNINVL